MHLTVGDVIRWNDYPYPNDGPEKARWFIYLGRTSIATTPTFAYLCTTTTKREKFNPGGPRSGHAHKIFDVRQFPIFDEDCILDYDEDLHVVSMEDLTRHEYHIEVKGRLDEETLRNIYKQYFRSVVVSKIQMIDIHSSFNLDGIEGLKKPK